MHFERRTPLQKVMGLLSVKNKRSYASFSPASSSGTKKMFSGEKMLSTDQKGWQPLAPSALAFSDHFPIPREMTQGAIDEAVSQFGAATRLALEAGFEVIEIHMAHGYLIHEFLSPLSNQRTDEYGGDFEKRLRFPLRVTEAVRPSPLISRSGFWQVKFGLGLRQNQFLRWLGVDF